MTLKALFALALILASTAANGQTVANLDRETEVVFLRKDDCSGYPLDRCVVDDLNGLNSWIWSTWYRPGPAAQWTRYLLVDIGPGEFTGNINCPTSKGRVTFRGAGREHSKIIGNGFIAPSYTFAVRADKCQDIAFENLTLAAYNATFQGIGVYWVSGGTSSWTNVDIEADSYAWYETCMTGTPSLPPLGEHYFFSGRFLSGAAGLWSECDLTWVYGSDILVAPSNDTIVPDGGSTTSTFSGVRVSGRGDLRLFGSTVRVSMENRTTAPPTGTVQGVEVGVLTSGQMPPGYGDFHSHGGIINVDASNMPGVTAVGIRAEAASGGDAMAHAHETAFNLKPGSGGSVVRLSGTGHFHSPFLWDAHPEPPAPAFTSKIGQDLYVETDCNGGGCSSSGTDPHLMIYSPNCSPTPWFDAVRGACRQ